MASSAAAKRWDVFCRVVDNFGDIGFCWRLAKCLTTEHAARVRLWVDDLESFARLEPGLDSSQYEQRIAGIDICRWREPLSQVSIADVVVQGFGSPLPDAYLAAMAAGPTAPVWIDLEYLSAEGWIDGFHGQPSPHPQHGLVKHFFFPGFTQVSGGLLREGDLKRRRDAFQSDLALRRTWWARLGLTTPGSNEQRLSLFCYPTGAVLSLWQSLEHDPGTDWTVLLAEHTLDAELQQYFGRAAPGLGAAARRGHLTVHVLPFLPQDEYDHLLWACDVNIVRGEDSFVRAQWAGRPLIWHIYPQDGGLHLQKLGAFLDRYLAGWPKPAADQLRALWIDWNGASAALDGSWRHWWAGRRLWERAVTDWSETLLLQTDLATRLAQFASDLLK